MIKGTLLMSFPVIKRFGRKFSENAYFLLSFSDPLKKPLEKYYMSETYGQFFPSKAVCPAIFGAKRRSAVLSVCCAVVMFVFFVRSVGLK